MRVVGIVLASAAALLVVAVGAAWIVAPRMNDRQVEGQASLAVLDAPVTVRRDDRGVPYIYAESLADALRAQGFVVGQDRLFQIELAKRAAQGRLAEIFGPGPDDVVLNRDRQARIIGFHRIATRHAAILAPQPRAIFDAYLEGLNAYIADYTHEHPRELALAGVTPEPWTLADALAFLYLSSWGNSGNFDSELIAQRILERLGPEALAAIAPLAINPDDPPLEASQNTAHERRRWATLDLGLDAPLWRGEASWSRLGLGGSNNWAISGVKAAQDAAIVTNDPHLDVRDLPGFWHPVGLITPQQRMVGVSAGLPGILVGRNDHIAFGVTNAYADVIDLYIETPDPADPTRYLEGDISLAFTRLEEVIRIADDTAPEGVREERLEIRFTRRGPVISDHGMQAGANAVLSLRWAAAEFLAPQLGIERLIMADSVADALDAVSDIRSISLNFVVGDVDGRVARRASGAAPVRLAGDGMAPFPAGDGGDNWAGLIPGDEMPTELEPPRGWTGTANHMTAPRDFAYPYATSVSPSYRYRRMQQLFSAPQVSAQDAWAAHHDDFNLFAQEIAPILASALRETPDADIAALGDTLAQWDYHDRIDAVAPTVFQEMIRQLARLTYEDELGPDLTADMLRSWYFWHERFRAMLIAGASPWFDDGRTGSLEDLPTLIRRAGQETRAALTARYGAQPEDWMWGAVHRVRFRGPLRLDGPAGRLTGNRDIAMPGSGETLQRALFPFHRPFDPYWAASLRMTADLNDPDKIRAVMPGGVVGRTFHAQLSDQIDDWLDPNAQTYWWFSDAAIETNTRTVLTLRPDL